MTKQYTKERRMHNAAMEFIFTSFHNWKGDRTDLNVLEIGSLDINGSVRPMFKPFQGNYVGIDMQEGPGVDIVADAAKFINFEAYDVIVCAEVFEHTPYWPQIIQNTYNNLVSGGLFIATMAGEGRYPHSAMDENPIREWEHYSNIGWWELQQTLKKYGFENVNVSVSDQDTRCWAVK
jgi:SAM-dependent methyltransferase